MTTKIRMYHCGFGDCYRLTDKNAKHLYVDFGILRLCPNLDEWKQKQYDFIINDMPPQADFILTHYHYDHKIFIFLLIACGTSVCYQS